MKKIVKLFLREDTIIEVLFDDEIVKRYDMLSLRDKYPELNKLKDRKLFLKGKVLGNSGIKWNDEIDIDADTIYEEGTYADIKEKIDSYILGYNLKQERLKQEMSQQELSKISGIDQGDISKIESGLANPTISTLNRICECLNKKIKYSLI